MFYKVLTSHIANIFVSVYGILYLCEVVGFEKIKANIRGPDSSVGIATGYGLDGPGIESRWGARFSAPVQMGRGDHPASCTMGTGSSPGVESGRGVTLTPHPLLVPRLKNRVELYLYSPQGPSWPVKKLKTYLQRAPEKPCANDTVGILGSVHNRYGAINKQINK
jgi:hypothetical protein